MAKKGAIKFVLTALVDSCELILFEPFLFLEITVTYITQMVICKEISIFDSW